MGTAVKDDLQLLNDTEVHSNSTSLMKWKRPSRTKIGILPNIVGGDGNSKQLDPLPSNYPARSQADSIKVCCPAFGVRDHRPHNLDLNDHKSVACSIL